MQTNRLIIDSVKETDKLDYFLNISHDKKVLETFICRYAETVDDLDFAPYLSNDKLFAIRLKETGKLIGIILYFDEKEGNCEIGYGIGSSYWNQGYVTEALECFIRYCFEQKGFDTVYASYFAGNDASKRVMEKCGMIYDRFSPKELTYLDVERDLIYYKKQKNSKSIMKRASAPKEKAMQLLKKATDPMFWQSVREKECFAPYVKEVLSMWENTCKDKPIPSLRYSDFKQFTITGSRKEYEDPYFARRHALDASALLSLIYPENEEYFNRLMDEIFAICDEYTWCVPAHHGAIDIENPNRIDLFAAETGFALAEIYTMLEDRLDPLIKSRVRTEIDRRIIAPFCSVDRYGFWENGTTNWTAVCVGSVACTCMLMRPELVSSLKPRFDRAMEFYLRGFEDDGICTEGCGYWHYGFGFFVVYADMIKTFTKGETDYFKLEKIKTIATFIQKMFLSENACVSFADGHPTLRYHLGLVHYLKSVYPDDVVVYDRKYSYNYDHCGRFCLQLRAAIWYNEAFENESTPKENVTYYGEDAEWFVHKTPLYGFAAKGGHNEENHNHNDVGSFIFAKDGVQVLTDPGPAKYTRQYFAAGERYTFFHSASRGHSVPIIDGAYQQTGIEYKAKNSRAENGVFTTDIAGAYGIAELHSLSRRFDCKEKSVTITDTISYEGKGKMTERLVCAFEPMQKEDGILSVHNCEIAYEKENVASVSISRHTFDGKPDCFTVDFELKEGTQTFTFTVK